MLADLARQIDQLDSPIQIELGNVLGDRAARSFLAAAHFDVGAEPADLPRDRLTGFGMLADLAFFARCRAAGLGEFAGELALGIVRAGDKRAEPSAAQGQPPYPALWALARIAAVVLGREQVIVEVFVKRLGHFRGLALHYLVALGLEVLPELGEQVLPVLAPVRHGVEFVFHPGGEIVGDIALEEPFQKGCEKSPGFLCEETVFLGPHIITVLQHLDRRGIGGRAADAELFQPLDQRRLAVARRRLGEVLAGLDPALGRAVALDQHRQHPAFVLFVARLLVERFIIDREKAGELDHLPGGAQFVLAGWIAQGDGGPLDIGAGHLARDRALPDQFVQPPFVAAAVLVLAEIGRADRFVSFLGVLGLGFIVARLFRQVMAVLVALRDRHPRGRDRARIHLHTIGPHIGDRALFVERLRHPHGMRGREAKLARGFHLQGRGGERRPGIAPGRPGLDLLDAELRGFDCGLGPIGTASIAKAQLLQLLAIEADQPRGEFGAEVFEPRQHRPVFLRAEQFDLVLALADQAQRDRLDPARTLGPGQFAPQHRRKGEAEQVIERAAGEVGVDQILVELARGLHRRQDHVLGDRIEGDSLDLLGQRLFLGQQFAHVPADCLAFSVRVSREDQAVGGLGGIGDRLHLPRLVAIELPVHGKVFVRSDRAVLGRQVADVAVAGEDLVVLAQIFLDGLGLGRGFYDDKLHGGWDRPYAYVYTRARVTGQRGTRQGGNPEGGGNESFHVSGGPHWHCGCRRTAKRARPSRIQAGL